MPGRTCISVSPCPSVPSCGFLHQYPQDKVVISVPDGEHFCSFKVQETGLGGFLRRPHSPPLAAIGIYHLARLGNFSLQRKTFTPEVMSWRELWGWLLSLPVASPWRSFLGILLSLSCGFWWGFWKKNPQKVQILCVWGLQALHTHTLRVPGQMKLGALLGPSGICWQPFQ